MEELINKTIVVTYDDITRMKDFCTNKGEGVTREFMDWYVNDNAFFSKTGMLVCERVISGSQKKFVLSFDFTNPDIPSFVMYDYAKQKPVCRYIFYREQNLAMKDISIKISWIDLKFFMQPDSIFLSNENHEKVKKEYDFEPEYPEHLKTKKQKMDYADKQIKHEQKKLKDVNKKLDRITYQIAEFMAEQGVYFCYATMYYFAKNKAKEIVGTPNTINPDLATGKQVTALYKYTGYVNINEAKVYQPVIKKDGPVREYGRHIEKWSVRGHYRRVGDKTIWIEPFEKGEGELEKRIYGTEKESEVNVIPKVFEVLRNVKDERERHDIMEKEVLSWGTPSNPYELEYKPKVTNIEAGTPARIKKPSFWSKVFSFFNKFKFNKP